MLTQRAHAFPTARALAGLLAAIVSQGIVSLGIVGLGIVGLGLATAARAQDDTASYPSRNIMLIVPYPPGGPPDVVARVLGPVLGDILGKPIVIENRPGASTSIGAAAVARAAPDGYTLLASDIAQTVAPSILVQPNFDPIKDFKHVGQTSVSVFTLDIDPKLPINTIGEFIAYARAKPGEIKVGHSGVGTPPHLGTLSVMQATGIEVLLVPYRGIAAAIQDVVAGHIQMVTTAPSTAVGLAREGKVRMLAVSGAQRLTAMPDVPTFKESGIELKGFDKDNWFGISVPAATPDAIVAKLDAAIHKAVLNSHAIDTLAKVEIKLVASSPQAFTGLIAQQVEAWRAVLKAAGVKPE